ncbi:MAG: DUF1761 domain-containing protein [Mangrovicoccus sp.]
MEIGGVLIAATTAWIFGALWYALWGGRWMAAAGLAEDQLSAKNPLPFVVSFLAAVLVAGMMRHIFAASGVEGLLPGALSGLGLGLFITAPWLVTNYVFANRSFDLMWIDGGYAVGGSTAMGAVLVSI